ncbi:MAG TPA: hypothetical protein VGB76_15395, partial [Pyrinomonadaceae bacterium]
MKSTGSRRKSLTVLIAMLFLVALALGGCRKESSSGGGGAASGGSGQKGGKKVIGFSQMEMDGPWR